MRRAQSDRCPVIWQALHSLKLLWLLPQQPLQLNFLYVEDPAASGAAMAITTTANTIAILTSLTFITPRKLFLSLRPLEHFQLGGLEYYTIYCSIIQDMEQRMESTLGYCFFIAIML
jgi:hypothetical protein